MDKKVLNQEELNYLKSFIMSRGFKDTGTIIEILDHLACKVEEIMTATPAIDLEEATARAHRSFGIRGFRGLAETYEAQLRRKYQSVYWGEIKATLKHPLHLLFLLGISMLSFKSYVWIARHEKFDLLDITIFTWSIFLLLILLDIIILRRTPERKRDNLILQIALAPNNFYWAPYLVIMINNGSAPGQPGLIVNACLHTFVVVFGILNFKARLKTLEQAKEEYYSIKDIV